MKILVGMLGRAPPLSYAPNHLSPISSRRRGQCQIVRAGYTRKPTGTPGAYHLIDDHTGHKFIVWGGVDSGDSPIPSDQVLLWKSDDYSHISTESPDRSPSPGSSSAGALMAKVDSSFKKKLNKSSTSGFGRLKAQHVRYLIKKSAQSKKGDKSSQVKQLLDRRTFHRDNILGSRDESLASEANGRFFSKKNLAIARQVQKDSGTVQCDNIVAGTIETDNNGLLENGKSSAASTLSLSLPIRGWSRAASAPKVMIDSVQQRRMGSGTEFFSTRSFKDLGCSDFMIKSLKTQGFYRPSHIQGMTYLPVLKMNTCIIADQSGSGKTLAYLAPVIQRLRQEELQGLGRSAPGCPRMIILVPTSELASQVLNNCRSISKCGVPFRCMVATGGFRQKTQLENLEQELDVLIATPGRFMFLLQERFLQLSNLKCAVLDEVDILFGDQGFEPVLQSLLQSAPVATQYLFVTATLPVGIYNRLTELFPDSSVFMGPGMHRTSSGLEEVLVDCSGNDVEEKNPDTAFFNKKSALLEILAHPVPKTIIFCNKIETCRKVENVLKRFDRKEIHKRVLPFHAALVQEVRLANIKEFLGSQSADSLFLICTDRASRGIDFVDVDHVVLFDFPRDPSEYVRRVGRTARGAGGKGKAFVFVVGKQVSLARRIMERNQKGHPLHDVPSPYEMSYV